MKVKKVLSVTRKLIEELPFSYLHVFSYSPRSGTEAYNFKNNIKNTIKKERNLILSNLVKEKAHLFYKNFIGKKVTVLIEEPKKEGVLKGYSEHYIPVRIDTDRFSKKPTGTRHHKGCAKKRTCWVPRIVTPHYTF